MLGLDPPSSVSWCLQGKKLLTSTKNDPRNSKIPFLTPSIRVRYNHLESWIERLDIKVGSAVEIGNFLIILNLPSSGERSAGHTQILACGWLDQTLQPQIKIRRDLLGLRDWFEAVWYPTLWQVRWIFQERLSEFFQDKHQVPQNQVRRSPQAAISIFGATVQFCWTWNTSKYLSNLLCEMIHGNRQEIFLF